MAGAVAGELSTMATGIIYCRMLCSSLDLHDFGRAAEWTGVIDRCAARPGLGGLPGDCRTHRASVLLKRGAWLDGEQEALRALEETERLELSHVGIAARELGDIRLRLGDSERAEEAFRRAQEYGISPEPGMSLLRLIRGDPAAATQGLQTALGALGDDRLARMRLLPAAVEAAVATEDLATARSAVAEVEETAGMYDKPAITATAEHVRGTLELADSDHAEAARRLQSALRLWQRLDAPYDAALARTLLAEAHLARGDLDSCLLELEAASASFERLGARIDLERARNRIAALAA
jgi:tetratricopeptide (TPR) repeat protein